MEKKIRIITAIIVSILSILIFSFLSYSFFNNKFLGLLSVFGFPLVCLLVSYIYIVPSDNRVWLRTVITGIIFSAISSILFAIQGFVYLNKIHNHEGFETVCILSFFMSFICIIFFFFYGSLIYFVKTKKPTSLILFSIVALSILGCFIYYVYQSYNPKLCNSEYLGDNVRCITEKCAMAPRNQERCLLKESKSQNLYFCEGFMTATEILYGGENSTGAQKFVNCAKEFFISQNSDASACSKFDETHRKYLFKLLCFRAYLQTNKPLVCKDIESVYEVLSNEESLKYFQSLCSKDSKKYQLKCADITYGFTSFELCSPGGYFYEKSKDKCESYLQLYNKYCKISR